MLTEITILCAQADGPRGLPALRSVPELGLPDMPAIALPADADAILAPLPAPRPQARPLPTCLLLTLAIRFLVRCRQENDNCFELPHKQSYKTGGGAHSAVTNQYFTLLCLLCRKQYDVGVNHRVATFPPSFKRVLVQRPGWECWQRSSASASSVTDHGKLGAGSGGCGAAGGAAPVQGLLQGAPRPLRHRPPHAAAAAAARPSAAPTRPRCAPLLPGPL